MAKETETPEAAESAPDPAARTGDADARVAELEARCAELEARWLRAQADNQNMRRRQQQELDSAVLRALQPLLDELLLVLDYLDLALASPATTGEARALAEGVSLTRAKLVQALELADVRPIAAAGPFDPARHEAVASRPAPKVAPGTIVATARPGYTWQGRILRPARVVIASAPEDGAGAEA